MSYLIDSHCHLHDRSCFPDGADEILRHAKENNVLQIVVVGTSHEDGLAAQKFAKGHKNVFWSYGIHPSEAGSDTEISSSDSMRLTRGIRSDRSPVTTGARERVAEEILRGDAGAVAIGEVGLDYHYAPYDRDAQIKLLEEMLDLAQKHDLPLIFHVREAFDDFFPVVDNAGVKRAVVHSFSDSRANLERALERGYYIGVNGLATFADIPLPPVERMLLETDAPYLTPVPFRGTINKSGYISNIADYLSTKLGVSREEIARRTTENVQALFHIPSPVLRAA